MDWLLYDRDLRHKSVNDIDFFCKFKRSNYLIKEEWYGYLFHEQKFWLLPNVLVEEGPLFSLSSKRLEYLFLKDILHQLWLTW